MARQSKSEIIERYQAQVLRDNKKEHNLEQALGRRVRIVSFESRSNGHNRPKRKHRREVNLIVDYSRKGRTLAYQIVRGEIRSRKDRLGLKPDKLAEEVLTDLPFDERTTDNLLDRLLEIRERKLRK